MKEELIDRLRADLIAADFNTATVRGVLGAAAEDARLRGVFAPARRVLHGLEPTRTGALISLFLLGGTVREEQIAHALSDTGVAGALELGLIERVEHGCRAALSLNPVEIVDSQLAEPARWWIISDLDDQLRTGPARADHVMGVGGATRSLIAQAPLASEVDSLDLGTGCGVVALHLALRGSVVATDISERALGFARANARLNDVRGIEFLSGSLFEPLQARRFDLILSNPPFVVTPRTGEAIYEYRDAGMVGDELAATVVRGSARHLRSGGTLLCLANWESPWGQDGLERVRGWIAEAEEGLQPGGLAAWVVERDRVSPARYAETWARDGGARPGTEEFEQLMEQWLADFADRRVAALGLGSIRIRRLPDEAALPVPLHHVERAGGAFSERPGDPLARAFDTAINTVRWSDAAMLECRWVLDPGVAELREHRPGEEAPYSIVLTAEAGIARRVTADPLLAAAMGACDGELTLGQIAGALATLLEVDESAAAEALVEGVRELIWLGMIEPAPVGGRVD